MSLNMIRTTLSSGRGVLMERTILPRPRVYGSITSRSISSSDLTIERTRDTTKFDTRPAKEKLTFGTTMSDHMLSIKYENGQWMPPRIAPFADLQLSPATMSLHYGLQCFEGMKAYKSLKDESECLLFRPDLNMKRLSSSMSRLQMPGSDFDHQELIKLIKELVRLDQAWIPNGEGYSLYIRPTVIATDNHLGLAPPESLLFYCFTCPVGPYYKNGFAPVKLTADTPYVRAFPGGTGNAKVGGNYAPTMKPQAEAIASGYDQVLWLFGDNEEITEVGSMNLFFLMVNEATGRKELVTAPLDRGDILPGVTRASVLELARSWNEFDVCERFPTMAEIEKAADERRLLEAFGAGTAAVVSPISVIQHKGEDIQIPATGEVTKRMWDEIIAIQYGEVDGPPGWSVKI